MAAEDVSSHVAEIGKVLPVSREVWEIAEHVALPLEDAGHYWGAVPIFHSAKEKLRRRCVPHTYMI